MKTPAEKLEARYRKEVMEALRDDFDALFPKDNQDHPERKSKSHRSEAMVLWSLVHSYAINFLRKIAKEVL